MRTLIYARRKNHNNKLLHADDENISILTYN
jgi:hypothetical protein